MAKDEGFVGRWSRLKREAREKPAQPSGAEPGAEPGDDEAARALPPVERSTVAPTGKAQPPVPKQGEEALPFDPASLPDLESLTYESDYSAFLQKGVPLELRNQALRRLWRSDPVLANLDGLVEYGEDYSHVGTKKMVVRTAYRVGRGMIDWALEEPDKPEAPAGGGEGDAPPAQERIEAGHDAAAETEPAETEPVESEAETELARPETKEADAHPTGSRRAKS